MAPLPTLPSPPAPPPAPQGKFKFGQQSSQPTLPPYNSQQEELLYSRIRAWQLQGWTEPPLVSFYRYIPPILQEGPQCGLVALAMVAAASGCPVSVSQLVHKAQILGFSYNGEMFSVDDMATLAQLVLPQSTIHEIKGLMDNQEHILEEISRGSVLLVPYDADSNHEPCCRLGHKSHWAAVCGAFVNEEGFMVAARQGKSSRLMIWNYKQLAASNDNLVELSPKRSDDGNKYMLGPGGVKGGLCGRVLVISNI